MRNVLTSLAILLTLGTTARADEPDRRSLEKLIGAWKGGGTMTAAGNQVPVKVQFTCERAAAGFGVRCATHILGIPGMEEFNEVEQLGYDNSEKLVHISTVCNAGEAHDMRGNWSGDTLTVKDAREQFEAKVVSARKLQIQVRNGDSGPAFNVMLSK